MQVFISYARADKALVDALVADVRALGHAAFHDSDLAGGQRWWDALLSQIKSSEAFLPVLSDAYRMSAACSAEARWADALGVPFVPIRAIDQVPVQVPGLYDPVIAEAHWIAYEPGTRDAMAALARGLASIRPVEPPQDLPSPPTIPLTYLTAIERQILGPREISRGDQLVLVSDLRSKLDTRDEPTVRQLLAALRKRPEITHEAATMIDALLRPPPDPPPKVPVPSSSPTQPPAPPPLRRPHEPASTQRAFIPGKVAWTLVALGTLMWVVAIAALPWAPYSEFKTDQEVVLEPRIWEGTSKIADGTVAFAVLGALAFSAFACVVVQRGGTLLVRCVGAALCVFVGMQVAAVADGVALSQGSGSGPPLYLGGLVVLAATMLAAGPRRRRRPRT